MLYDIREKDFLKKKFGVRGKGYKNGGGEGTRHTIFELPYQRGGLSHLCPLAFHERGGGRLYLSPPLDSFVFFLRKEGGGGGGRWWACC